MASYAYGYDAVGRRTSASDTHEDRSSAFRYDAVSRLLGETTTEGGIVTRDVAYVYDAVGNRVRLEDSVDGVVNSTYDAAGRLIDENGVNLAWDDAGQLSEVQAGGSRISLSWDTHSRLVSLDLGGGQIVHYTYDSDGRRTVRDDGVETIRFLHDTQARNALLLGEFAGGAAQARFVHGVSPVSQSRGGQRHYYMHDAHGVRQLTNGAGAVTDRYRYDAFGRQLQEDGPTTNPLRYRGEYRDDALGWYDLRARWYDPARGRFPSRDPFAGVASDPRTLHRYNYVNGNPLNLVDPSGEFGIASVSIGISIGSIIGSVALGIFGSMDANERENMELNSEAAHSIWGTAAALAIASARGYVGAYKGRADAIRHCTWNAIMAIALGRGIAERLATAHEDAFPSPIADQAIDRQMDLHNNAQGRQAGGSQGLPLAFRYVLGGLAAFSAWTPGWMHCDGKLDSGALRVIDESTNPDTLVPSNTPGLSW